MANEIRQPHPHAAIERVFDDIWFVRGGWTMPVPGKPKITRAMTILRDPQSGDVTLVNSMRLSEEGLKQLAVIGPIKNVVRLASMHGADDAFYRERYGAKIFALRGTQYTRGLTANVVPGESYQIPDAYYDENGGLPIRNARVYAMKSGRLREASVLLERDGGILLTGDFFHNTPKPDEFTNTLTRVAMRLFGLARPYNMGVGWLLLTKPDEHDILSLLDIPFEHVLPIHGLPVLDNAKEHFRPAIEKFARKARRRRLPAAKSLERNELASPGANESATH